MRKIWLLALGAALLTEGLQAQQRRDQGVFKEYKPGYYQNSILKGVADFEQQQQPAPKHKSFKADVSGLQFPNDKAFYQTYWHGAPVSQGNTSTCWAFSSTSFFEAEIYRLSKQQVKLSEMYTVYFETIEKARRFVQERGNSNFDEGSEANATLRMMKIHGAVPHADYTGLKPGQPFHDHSKMWEEMKAYLGKVKENNAWDEAAVLATIRSIMHHYMGEPPVAVTVNGKKVSPQDYLRKVLKFIPEDYVDVTNLLEKPMWEKVEYAVPDNWWHSADYFNVPLDTFMKIVKTSIRGGYTIFIGGDVSESGFVSESQVAIIPSYDIPREYIDDHARQFRFSNRTTTDDHGMHIVGYKEQNGQDWYLVKDSGAGSRNGGTQSPNFGYYFFHEDYVKLKMMCILVHKDMVQPYLQYQK